MNHKITISTVEALVLNKALRLDLQNETDRIIANILVEKVNHVVEKDLKKPKETDLTNKCGSCKWSSIRRGSYIDCNCPSKKPNFFSRTNPKCKKYEMKDCECNE